MKDIPKWARLSPEEFQKRLRALQTVYNQKDLSNILGVSVRSINYYQKGESFPRSKEVYQNINALYNRTKSRIKPEAVEKKTKQRKERSDAQKYGRVKWRTTSIYPDYMYNSPASDFEGVKDWDKLEELSEEGFVAGWRGRNILPMEVQFVINGEGATRFGKVVRIVGIVTRMNSPKLSNGWTGDETELVIFPTYYRLIPGLKKSDSFEDRMDKVRDFFFGLDVSKGYPLALLGFYFDELDEI